MGYGFPAVLTLNRQRCLHSTVRFKFIGKRKPQLRKGVELGLKKLYLVSLLSTTLASLAGLYEFVLSSSHTALAKSSAKSAITPTDGLPATFRIALLMSSLLAMIRSFSIEGQTAFSLGLAGQGRCQLLPESLAVPLAWQQHQ